MTVVDRPVATPLRARVAAVAALAAGADVAVDPVHRHLPLCPLHALTGLDCPLCGSLRAVDELLHGNLAVACRDNVLLVVALPVLVWMWFAAPRRLSKPAVVALVVVGAVYTVVRNLPFATALRPG